MTKNGEEHVLLKNRGDGIQVRYLPSIINYLAMNSSERFIWGFEEPENSLEFNMARRMAEDFYNVYSENSQIFVTTHSPAFIDLGKREKGSGFRCYMLDSCTEIAHFKDENSIEGLAEELGYAFFLQKQYDEYKSRGEELERMSETINSLKGEIEASHRPVLLTEGKTDAKILKVAWDKLFNGRICPFDIKSCALTDTGDESAGCSVLGTILKGVRYDAERPVIGLFDNDDAGIKAFDLGQNYIMETNGRYKVNKNRKGYAVLLQSDNEEVQKIANHRQLSIEFMFSRTDLQTNIDGKGLEIKPAKIATTINGKVIQNELPTTDISDEFWFMGKLEHKVEFADYIVPTLGKESFSNFMTLFNILLEIVSSGGNNA